MWRPNGWRGAIVRIAAGIVWGAGLFILPWGVLFLGLFTSIAVFRWYGEALVIGFGAAALAGFEPWKIAVPVGFAILASEAMSARFQPRLWFSYAPIAVLNTIIASVVFLLVL